MFNFETWFLSTSDCCVPLDANGRHNGGSMTYNPNNDSQLMVCQAHTAQFCSGLCAKHLTGIDATYNA